MADVTADIATLGIGIEMKEGKVVLQQLDQIATKGEQVAQRVSSAFTRSSASLRNDATKAAKEVTDALTKQFDADSARVKEGLARGLLTKQQARQAGIDAGKEFNAGVLSQLDALGKTGLNAGNSAAYRELASSLKTVGAEAQAVGGHSLSGAGGLSRLRLEMTTMVRRLLDLNPALAQFTNILGGMALGSVTMIAVLGGVAALGFAYEKLTEKTRKAREEHERLVKAATESFKAFQLGPVGEQVQQQIAVGQEITKVQQQIADQLKGTVTGGSFGVGAPGQVTVDKTKIAELQTQLKQLTGTYLFLSGSIAKHGEELELDIRRQQALNAEFARGGVSLDNVNLEFDRQKAILALGTGTDKETLRLKALTNQLYDARDAYLALQQGQQAVAASQKLQASAVATAAANRSTLNTFSNLFGPVGTGAGGLPGVQQLGLLPHVDVTQFKKDIAEIGKANEEATRKDTENQVKHMRELGQIWREGIGNIVTDGLKSFQDFSEDVYRLFSRLMKKLEADGKTNSLGYKLLGIGSAAIAGASTGYSSGDIGLGILSGGLAGAQFGPIGATVGAFAGLTGALFGGAKAARERREAEEQLRQSLDSSVTQIKNQLGIISDLDTQLAAIHTQFDQLRQQVNDLLHDRAITRFDAADRIAELNALEQRAVAQAQIQAQIDTQTQSLQTAQDALGIAQQQLTALQAIVTSLQDFKNSLVVGPYSPLSPRAQLDAARSQLNTVFQAALGGDQTAAGQFQGLAQQFLTSSRAYNASGAGYVLDFNTVRVMTDQLLGAFGARVTDQQRLVDAAQSQVDLLQQILTELQNRRETNGLVGGANDAQHPTTNPNGSTLQSPTAVTSAVVAADLGQQSVDLQQKTVDTLEQMRLDLRRGLDEVRQAVAA